MGRPLFPILRIWGLFKGAFREHFEHFFADAAKLKKCNPFKRNACFGRCWASGFALFLLTFCMCFLCCFLDGFFSQFWWILASKEGPFWTSFSQILQILHEKKRAEIEARKLMTFGRLLGGAGGSGEACLSLQILQSMVSGFNHALLPLRGCGES